MPRINEDFYLERMGKALGFGKLLDAHPGTFSNNVRPVKQKPDRLDGSQNGSNAEIRDKNE